MRSPLLLLLLLPSLVAAQTTSLTIGYPTNLSTTKTLTLGLEGCNDTVTVNWTFSQNACAPLDIWVVDDGTRCSDTVPQSNVFLTTVSTADVNAASAPAGGAGGHASTVTFTLDQVFAKVPKPSTTAVDRCGRPEVQETRNFNVCASTQVADSLNNCNVKLASSTTDLRLVYDHERPTPPDPAVRPGEGKLIVTAPGAGADIASMRVQYRSETEVGFKDAGTGDPGQGVEIEGLENNTRYFVQATWTDLAGNESDFSAVKEGMPLATVDFWEKYEQAGGTDQGGCGAASGAGLSMGAALAMVALWLALRRRAS